MNNLDYAINYPAPEFSIEDGFYGTGSINPTSALLYLILYDYEHKAYTGATKVRSAIYSKVAPILAGGKEPAFDNSCCWGYSLLCESFALIKRKPELWALFSEDEQNRMKCLMQMFLIMWQWGCNKYNNYKTGASMRGNYNKMAGANYKFTNNLLIAFCCDFLEYPNGYGTWTYFMNILNYDEKMAELKNFGFTNAYKNWTTPERIAVDGTVLPSTKTIWENGGQCYREEIQCEMLNTTYAGWGNGIHHSVQYHDAVHPEEGNKDIPLGVIEHVFTDCFNNICVSQIEIEDYDYTAGIADGTISPYEGQYGMMQEFNIEFDGISRRSSIYHCDIDFVLAIAAIATLKHLNIIDLREATYWPQIVVGMEDYIYKIEHGYNSFSLGFEEKGTFKRRIDKELWLDYWKFNYRE